MAETGCDGPVGRPRGALLGSCDVRRATLMFAALLVFALFATAVPALAHHREGPCDVHRREGETVRRQMKRIIRCAVDRWPVEGDARKAICIARAESDLNPEAESLDGTYVGLYQHLAEAWPDRYDTWTQRRWRLKERPVNGRSNAIVSIRMASANGWTAWGAADDC